MQTTVRLRRYSPTDREALAALFADPDVTRYAGDGKPMEANEAHVLLDKILCVYATDPAFHIYAIEERGEYAGHAEIKRRAARAEYELIYFLQRSRWRRGLGGAVVDLLLTEAQAHRIPFVIATVDSRNHASVAILRRRGFVEDPALSNELACPAYRLELRGKV